jgi:chromosome partitioning related protein ParA
MKNLNKNPQIIAVVSTKGGVGKTTSSANLGAFLADQGLKILLIDADVQPSLSEYYCLEEVAAHGLSALITNPQVTPQDISSRIDENLHIVLSDDPDAELQKWVRDTPDGRFRLKRILKDRFQCYDFIIIDTQGAVGSLQEATILAADLLISPVVPDKLCAAEFLHNTLGMINKLSESAYFMGFDIAPLHAYLNRSNNTSDSSSYANQIRDYDYDSACRVPVVVAQAEIPDTVVFKDAASAQIPAHIYEKTTRRKGGSAYEVLQNLSKELGFLGGDA